MKFRLDELMPWAPVFSILSRMKSLTVKVGGVEYRGAAELSLDDGNRATLAIEESIVAKNRADRKKPK
jgi:hypothetical protein